MKTERARDLYSDYAEGTLSPALRLAMDQHFATDADARQEYQEFSTVYKWLDTQSLQEVEVPLGFRAKLLERVSTEQARRESAPGYQASLTLTGWFRSLGRRRATGGVLAVLAGCALVGVVLSPHSSPGPSTGSQGPFIPFSAAVPTTLMGVTSMASANGTQYDFQVHLPADVPSATVKAYVLTNNDQITEPNLLATATPALSAPQALTNTESMTIPVTVLQAMSPGTTLNMLVQWTPTGSQTTDSQVVFTPTHPGVPGPSPKSQPVSFDFYDALQSVAADDGVTVIADSGTAPTQSVTEPTGNSPAQAKADLQQVAAQVGGSVQTLPSGAYLVTIP